MYYYQYALTSPGKDPMEGTATALGFISLKYTKRAQQICPNFEMAIVTVVGLKPGAFDWEPTETDW